MTAIIGEYIQLQTYKEKPYVTLHIDFPEEMANEIIQAIGWKKSGESIYLGITLMDKKAIGGFLKPKQLPAIEQAVDAKIAPTEKTDGERMVTRAVMLCKDWVFKKFGEEFQIAQSNIVDYGYSYSEDDARSFLCRICNIESRSELKDNREAQMKFLELMDEFNTWKFENQYEGNIEKMD